LKIFNISLKTIANNAALALQTWDILWPMSKEIPKKVKMALKEILYLYDGIRLCRYSYQYNWQCRVDELENFMREQMSLWAIAKDRNSNGKLNEQNVKKEVAEFLEEEFCLQSSNNWYTGIDVEIDVRDNNNNVKTHTLHLLKDIDFTKFKLPIGNIEAIRKVLQNGAKNPIEENLQDAKEVMLRLRHRFFPRTFDELVAFDQPVGYFDDGDFEPLPRPFMKFPYLTVDHKEWLQMLNSLMDVE